MQSCTKTVLRFATNVTGRCWQLLLRQLGSIIYHVVFLYQNLIAACKLWRLIWNMHDKMLVQKWPYLDCLRSKWIFSFKLWTPNQTVAPQEVSSLDNIYIYMGAPSGKGENCSLSDRIIFYPVIQIRTSGIRIMCWKRWLFLYTKLGGYTSRYKEASLGTGWKFDWFIAESELD